MVCLSIEQAEAGNELKLLNKVLPVATQLCLSTIFRFFHLEIFPLRNDVSASAGDQWHH